MLCACEHRDHAGVGQHASHAGSHRRLVGGKRPFAAPSAGARAVDLRMPVTRRCGLGPRWHATNPLAITNSPVRMPWLLRGRRGTPGRLSRAPSCKLVRSFPAHRPQQLPVTATRCSACSSKTCPALGSTTRTAGSRCSRPWTTRPPYTSAQGPGHWQTVVARTFDRITRPHGYTVGDLRVIRAPVLILTGDRDPFCVARDTLAAYHALPAGRLAVLPNTGHLITPAAVRTVVEFFEGL